MNKIRKQAEDRKEQMRIDRRYLHQNPEIGMDLPKTVSYIGKRLSEMNIEWKPLSGRSFGKDDGGLYRGRIPGDEKGNRHYGSHRERKPMHSSESRYGCASYPGRERAFFLLPEWLRTYVRT